MKDMGWQGRRPLSEVVENVRKDHHAVCVFFGSRMYPGGCVELLPGVLPLQEAGSMESVGGAVELIELQIKKKKKKKCKLIFTNTTTTPY